MLLSQLGITPDHIHAPEIDETPRPGEPPRVYAARLAVEKAEAAIGALPGALILASDTTVACGRRILPQAQDEQTARACLKLLSGRRHKVYSAVALIDREGRTRSRLAVTIVGFKRLSPAEIDAYIASGDWRGKAGGYAVQGHAAGYVKYLAGSYTGVVGLPLYETRALLNAAGYHVD